MLRIRGILCLFAFCIFAVLLSSPIFQDAHTTTESTPSDPNAIHWKQGELAAPLPADPALRAEAIRMAKERGAARAQAEGRTPTAGVQKKQLYVEPTPVSAPHQTRKNRSRPTRTALPFTGKLKISNEPYVATEEERQESYQNIVTIDPPVPAPASGGPMGYFDAIDDTGYQPASPSIAVGTEHVLVATTDVYAIYDKCGHIVSIWHFPDRFNVPEGFVCYDPKVIYDDWKGRWIMVYQANDFTNEISRLYVVISHTGNLGDGWAWYYSIQDPIANSFVDNTYIAVGPEGLYITFNPFEFVGFASTGSVIMALETDLLYDGSAVSIPMWLALDNPADASDAFGIRPARMHSYDGAVYFINNKMFGGNFFTLWTLTDPFGTSSISGTSISVGTYETPPNMMQPNGSVLDVGDCRITDAIYSHGTLQSVFTRLYSPSTDDWSMITIFKFDAAANTYQGGQSFLSTSGFAGYGSIDIDEIDRTCMVMSHCSYSLSLYPSLYYFIWDWVNHTTVDGANFAYGTANYTAGYQPYRWGHYTGCQIDPLDDRTFWMAGAYAHHDPTPSWMVGVATASGYATSNLVISPEDMITSGGTPGGPFTQEIFTYTLENSGATDLNWCLENLPTWLTPSSTGGVIPPYGSQQVMLVCNSEADLLPAGFHVAEFEFTNCNGSGSMVKIIGLFIAEEIVCDATYIPLGPEGEVANIFFDACTTSIYVTPLKDIDVCAVGIQAAYNQPNQLIARVYETDGFTNRNQIGEVFYPTLQTVQLSTIVPMDITLEACRDYEIEFIVPADVWHYYLEETGIQIPYDVNGVIRVTQGGRQGDHTASHLPIISIYGKVPCNLGTTQQTDLLPGGTTSSIFADEYTNGIFFNAQDNMELCHAYYEADLPRNSELRVLLYEASGTSVGPLVSISYAYAEEAGMRRHEIPIASVLEYGQDYYLEILHTEGGTHPYTLSSELTLPFMTDDDRFEVYGAMLGKGTPRLPHIWFLWDELVSGGVPWDLAKISDGIPPPYTSLDPMDHGAFVTMPASQHLFGLGVMADIPPGSILTARVYSTRPSGEQTVRSMLLSEGWIATAKVGMAWHDVPLAIKLSSGKTYDFSLECSSVNEFGYWDDTTGMPYQPYGLYTVENAEIAGSTSGTELIHMRLHACDDQLTAIDDGDVPRAIRLALEPPVPNPASGTISFHYTIDEACVADMAIYDVLGRRVAEVFSNRQVIAGPGVAEYDASGLASGVYFLKLSTPTSGVSRKIVVRH